ncbi:glycosyltransferase family 2 protein [Streptomyces fenghuangensis]|uniref:Glycosyltransferase family 2 protein n=1 Tax=Streptomyces chitinivorans TaxID=1257027 RepID=A0ABW7I2C9_9ACTN|nr:MULTISPECIES: glycosyltransferase family 2 protein [Streptomyces]MCG3043053.1 glycosyltransferase [Streptomyces sp. ICN903]MDH2411213.1 glycosyltransferase family 2 protein [Streptomyces chitinivorans]
MPKLSVIVPFHNVQEYAQDTLRSLAANARPGTEFVLVDDCSTDATAEILDRAVNDLPRARLVRHEENRGIAQARNTGIEAAEGEYLTFLDGDDWYAPGYLRELLHAAEELDCDFVRTDHVQSTGRDRTVKRAPARRRDAVLSTRDAIAPAEMETMVDYPFVWAGIYRRGLFETGGDGLGMRFTTHLRTAEDRVFVWQLHLRAKTFATVGLLGVFYRRGVTTSLTQIRDARQLDFIPAHDLILAEVAADREAERFLPKIVRTYCAMIAFHAVNAHRYEPAAARRLKHESAAALRRMPREVLERTLTSMDHERARTLRRLLGGTARKAA